MAKTKSAARKRRAYEYDHEYGLSLVGKASRTSRGGVSRGQPSPRPAKPTTVTKAAKKR